VCTSGGYGTKFEASGRFHHLFDPLTGASAHGYLAVSVLATNTMIADALSTALYVTPPQRSSALLASFPAVSALATLPDGRRAASSWRRLSACSAVRRFVFRPHCKLQSRGLSFDAQQPTINREE
jgi:thiamine biosynthesis lipoprotein ApbE